MRDATCERLVKKPYVGVTCLTNYALFVGLCMDHFKTMILYSNLYVRLGSNENSFFIMNMKTTENTPCAIFTLKNHVLFRMHDTTFNVIQSVIRCCS